MASSDTYFKKGHKLSPESLLKMRNSLKGHIPWNKGTKGKMVAWNKGKKTGHTPWNKGKKLSEEIRQKLSLAQKGVKRPNRAGAKSNLWKGGVTEKNHLIRTSLEYKLWRTAVFERDNYKCVWCGDYNYEGRGKTVVLHADHIKPFCNYPELRFAIDNGRTLCVDCHKTTDTWGRPNKI